MSTVGELTAEEVARYRAAARQRHQEDRRALVLRERRAWELARRAADLRPAFRRASGELEAFAALLEQLARAD